MARARGVPAAVALFFVGTLLLAVAWTFSNPLDAAHDEVNNHVKALASGRGEWSGSAAAGTHTNIHGEPLTALQRASLDRMTEDFHLPVSMAIPATDGCVANELPASCQAILGHDPGALRQFAEPAQPSGRLATEEGPYPPAIYALEGAIGAWLPGFAPSAYAVRLTGELVACLLWAGAAYLTLDRSDGDLDGDVAATGRTQRWRLVGLMAAMSPMAFFLPTTESPNGIEIAGAACFCAALLRLTATRPRRLHWVLAAASGVTFALSRQLDPAFLAIITAAVLTFRGSSTAMAVLRAHRRPAAWLAGAVAAASASTVIWDVVAMPTTGSWRSSLLAAETDLTNHVAVLVDELVGVFGWSTVTLPTWSYLLWFIVVGLLAAASLRGTKHQAAAIVAVAVAVVYCDAAIDIFTQAPMGWGTDSRYVLAMAVALPLLCAELPPPRRLPAFAPTAAVAALGAVQATAVWVNLRHYAVGPAGPMWFVGRGWAPPGGQVLWLSSAILGAVALGAVPLLARSRAGAAGHRSAPAGPPLLVRA